MGSIVTENSIRLDGGETVSDLKSAAIQYWDSEQAIAGVSFGKQDSARIMLDQTADLPVRQQAMRNVATSLDSAAQYLLEIMVSDTSHVLSSDARDLLQRLYQD